MTAWILAQIMKMLISTIVTKKFDIRRLLGDGGMPSGHSATVTAVAIGIGMEHGFQSTLFALASIFAVVVMRDAMGVRRETGKQAVAINKLLENMKEKNINVSSEDSLKEFIGHTPFQVLIGALLGIGVGMAMSFVFGHSILT